MPTESGYSNQKKFGDSQYKTIHSVGSDKFAENVITKGLVERQTVNIAITAIAISEDRKSMVLEIVGHGSVRPGDVVRFFTGPLATVELDIVDVLDVDMVEVLNVMEVPPQVGDEVRVAYYRTPQFDSSGSVVVNVGPSQFVLDGVDVEVEQDTVDPTNNKPLPAGLYIYKENVIYPVKDSATPADVVAIPVKIMAVDGTNINITAGDINIQVTDMGAGFDSLRVGDGSGIYLTINGDGSINVLGPLTDAELRAAPVPVSVASLPLPTGAATEATLSAMSGKLPATLGQKAMAASLAVVLASDQSAVPISAASLPLPTGASTEATLSAINTKTPALVTGRVPVDGSGVTQPISAASLPLPTGAATEATLSAMSGKLPATLGQKTSANSLAVVPASDYVPPAPAVPSALTVKNATVTAGVAAIRATTDAAAPSATRRKLRIFMDPDTTTGKLYLGSATVTAAGATKGEQIFPGVPTVFDDDANDYYIISDTASNPVSIVEVE